MSLPRLASLLLTATLLLAAAPAFALQATFPVQGLLRAAGGGPVADGKYTLTLRLYQDVTAQQALWKEVHVDVPVQAGTFFLVLGGQDPQAPVPAGIFAQHPAVTLGVQVSTEPELPRSQLYALPYALHAATADALTGKLTGAAIEPGSLPAASVGFAYAGSDSKGGPALELKCTGCIGKAHLEDGLLAANNVAFQDGAKATHVQAALGGLTAALKVDGAAVGIGKVPGNVCALDVATEGGESCIDGVPALWTRFASNDGEMDKLAKEGQVVYRKDQKKVWVRVGTAWRELQLKALCGDGVVEPPEACDDGANNADLPDKCRITCAKPACGDKIQDSGEACDDGNLVSTDACIACVAAKCGDGFVHAGVEACDDGNDVKTDACVACQAAKCGDGFLQVGIEVCDDGNEQDGDGCSAVCQYEGAPAYKLTGAPDPASVFNNIDTTFYYPNNLVNGIWHGKSNRISVGHYSSNGYWSYTVGQSYPCSPNNGSGGYHRMVLVPKTSTVVYGTNGLNPPAYDQIKIGSIDEATGAVGSFQGAQFGDNFTGKCNLFSAAADQFLCYDGSVIRRYTTTKASNFLKHAGNVTLAQQPGDTCGSSCYMGTFAWDGLYFYFTNAGSSSTNLGYKVYKADGSVHGSYTAAGSGAISGAYFDWSVGRYVTHDGWGNRGGGTKYTCSGGSQGDDSQSYSPVSSAHAL